MSKRSGKSAVSKSLQALQEFRAARSGEQERSSQWKSKEEDAVYDEVDEDTYENSRTRLKEKEFVVDEEGNAIDLEEDDEEDEHYSDEEAEEDRPIHRRKPVNKKAGALNAKPKSKKPEAAVPAQKITSLFFGASNANRNSEMKRERVEESEDVSSLSNVADEATASSSVDQGPSQVFAMFSPDDIVNDPGLSAKGTKGSKKGKPVKRKRKDEVASSTSSTASTTSSVSKDETVIPSFDYSAVPDFGDDDLAPMDVASSKSDEKKSNANVTSSNVAKNFYQPTLPIYY